MTKAMLIDVSKCIACRACQVACKAWNDLQAEITVCAGCYDNPTDLSPDTWNRIAFWELERDGGRVDWVFRPVRCMHCTDAPCVRVCPTGALFKDSMGFTAYDESKCNGCGYCVQFCPFDVPRLKEADLWGKGKTTKCTFCQDRVRDGLAPACAKAQSQRLTPSSPVSRLSCVSISMGSRRNHRVSCSSMRPAAMLAVKMVDLAVQAPAWASWGWKRVVG